MTELSGILDDYYEAIEFGFEVESSPAYGQLVMPNGNASEPVHRWFHLKEGFSCDLVRRVLKDTGALKSESFGVLDPFAGVGTTATSVLVLAAAGELREPSVYGIEINPFLHLVANSKIRAYLENRPVILDSARRIAASSLRSTTEYEPPGLSTFHDERYFDPAGLQSLLRLREAVRDLISQDGHTLASEILLLALGATVGAVANLRRDGRALRYTPKTTGHAVDIFLERCELIEEDLPTDRPLASGGVINGDGVRMNAIDPSCTQFDLILFSPPYPNNIDYSEIYKLENWFLGFISDSAEFRQLRLSTVHSHPSIRRPNRLPDSELTNVENKHLADLVSPLVEALPSDRYQCGRREVLEGYILDMYRTLCSARDRLSCDGRLVYVVGNSAHGRGDSQFVIAADLLIASAACLAGLEVERVQVARHLRRRSCASRFLRESVVFVHK